MKAPSISCFAKQMFQRPLSLLSPGEVPNKSHSEGRGSNGTIEREDQWPMVVAVKAGTK